MPEPGPENKSLIQPDGSPDWDHIAFDVLCSRCGYNLRTLTRPRCTECGLDFEWRRVLDRAAFQNPFLIEHNWRRRPVRSWGLTVWRSLRPKRFWGQVSLHEEVRPAPLIAHFFLAITTAFAMLHGSAWALARALNWALGPRRQLRGSLRRTPMGQRLTNLEERLDNLAAQPSIEGWGSPVWNVLAVVTPFLGALVLLFALRQTMRRYRVRFVHVLRVVGYMALPICLWCALAYLLTDFVLPTMFQFMYFRKIMKFSLAVFVWGVFSWYLWRGFKQYLHLPHAAILGMTAALVGLLTLVTGNLVVGVVQELMLG